MEMTIPKILEMPDKLYPIVQQLNNKRYFLLEGGRGSGKSNAYARFILFLAEKYNLRIVCGRETQNSINESVYSLLTDLIRTFSLNFNIQAQKITHNISGSQITFRGFREQGAFNIQGLEGIDILWIDEAQAITKQTLDVLIPTIRKDKAKVFFSMNRHVYNDPVFERFYSRDDCLHIHIDYFENPFCTEALKKEAQECKKVSDKDYKHIWLGEPLDQSEDAVFALPELLAAKRAEYLIRQGYGMRLAGFDIARYGDDKCACVILQQQGAIHWKTCFIDEWENRDLNYTTGRILSIHNEQRCDISIIDEDGIGCGPLDNLNKGRGLTSFRGFRNPSIAYSVNKSYANNRTANAYKLKDLVSKGQINLTDDKLIAELLTLRYTFDHNQRRMLIPKDKMKKEGVKSPNIADACIMAASLIGEQIQKQDDGLQVAMPQYSKEEDLYSLAGVK